MSAAETEARAKHTEGPWRYIDATTVPGMQYAQRCVIMAGDKQVASFSWNDKSPWFPTKSESQANAALIAAAPDLLRCLQLVEAVYRLNCVAPGEPSSVLADMQAAILKAEAR